MDDGAQQRAAGGSVVAHRPAEVALPPPLPATLQPATLQQGQRLTRRVEQAAVLWSLLVQACLHIKAGSDLSPEWRLCFAALALLRVACLVVSLCLPPATWAQHRTVLIFAARVLTCILMQSSTGGAAVLLSHQASSGLLGVCADLLKAISGTRLLEICLSGLLFQLPPLATAAQAALLLAFIVGRGNADYCATPLMKDPLTTRRVEVLWDGLELLPLMGPPWAGVAGMPAATDALSGGTDASAQHFKCISTLVWLECLLGVLLPTLVAARTEPTTAALAPPAVPGSSGSSSRGESSSSSSSSSSTGGSWSQLGFLAAVPRHAQRAAAAAYRTWAALDAAVCSGCRLVCGEVFLLTLLLFQWPGFLWLLSKAIAARSLGLSML